MKKFVVSLGCIMALSLLTGAANDPVRTFHGDVADSQCALNVHSLTRSHQEMLKSKAIGGSVTACAQYCIRYLGGDFVLSSKKEVYRLDNQEEAAKFAGEKVKVTGTLTPKSDTIHVIKIEADDKAAVLKQAAEEKPAVRITAQ